MTSLDRSTLERWLNEGAHALRSLFSLAQQYRYSGCTRDDFAAKNAAARAALEKFGDLPQDVLEGARRSKFAPPVVRRGLQRHAFTIVTQVLVDKNDSAFKDPTKPIGSFMDETTAMQMKQAEGWDVVEDAGRGWRRVVASPHPVQVVEQDAITAAVQQGWIVIAGGGGGIPVVQTPQGLEGVAAVIDKDRLSALLAAAIKADLFVISTAVEKVCLHYGKPNQQDLTHITAEQARQYMNEGHFAPGSMKPKMEAVLQFLDEGGKRAIITNPENLERALLGETGTVIEGH